jgi:hypothetical protein
VLFPLFHNECIHVETDNFEFSRPNGVTFVAEPITTALTSKWKLKSGDIVTFKHRGFWLGTHKPKAPTICRLRLDKTWNDVVSSFDENKLSPIGTLIYFHFWFGFF